MDRRRAIYHPDLLWPPRVRKGPTRARREQAATRDAQPCDPADTDSRATHVGVALDTTRAYEMLRASASLAVPLLCLATKG